MGGSIYIDASSETWLLCTKFILHSLFEIEVQGALTTDEGAELLQRKVPFESIAFRTAYNGLPTPKTFWVDVILGGRKLCNFRGFES
jgi:hypothetical protein